MSEVDNKNEKQALVLPRGDWDAIELALLDSAEDFLNAARDTRVPYGAGNGLVERSRELRRLARAINEYGRLKVTEGPPDTKEPPA
jgi:hypothetical protein